MLNLYTETAFQVTPATPASSEILRIPRRTGSYDKSKFTVSKVGNNSSSAKDEQAYISQSLASQSSIYFRESKTYPRTFYWKVINLRILEVQCADVARSESDTKEAYLTLRFELQDPIAPHGVAFADLNNSDELHVFVSTTNNEIFNLCIPTDAFRNTHTLHNDNLTQWCQPLESSSLGIDTAHRLYAPSPLVVFISFGSGQIQRLTRKSVQGPWEQHNYNDRTWMGSVRGLMSMRTPVVEYGSARLNPKTAQAMAASGDGELLFTVCLDHKLRVWHLKTGKILAIKDLLDANDADDKDSPHLNPAEDTLLQLFKEAPSQKFPTVLTYSPRDGGQFKFWDIKGSLTDTLLVEDKYRTHEKLVLTPPDPDPSGNTVWSMIGFKIDPGTEFKSAQLWVLWRNHNYHQLYNCQLEFRSIVNSWKDENWAKCNGTASAKIVAPDFARNDQDDPSSKWLKFFFQPGRYSEDCLETALSIFEQATAVKLTASQKSAPLHHRLCSVIAANVSLRKYGDSDMDFDRFNIDTDSQWRNFYRIAENVGENRNAPLSLAHDSFSEMVWITMADKCCAVRECSMIEMLQQNELGQIQHLEEAAARMWPHRKVSAEDGEPFTELAVLIDTARTFRGAFPADLARDFEMAIEDDISIGVENLTPTRLLNIYDNVGFGDGISNEVFEKLEADLSAVGGISGLNNELFLGVLELLASKSKKAKSSLRNTLFGSLLLSAGVQDSLSAQRQLLTDLLALVIFVEGELSQEDVKSAVFDASELHDQIAPLLRLCERNLWLASHTRHVPLEILGTDGHPNIARHRSKFPFENKRQVTIFEDTLSKAVRPQPAVEKPLMYLITDQLSEIDDWATGGLDPEEGAVFLQCDLLKQGEFNLATDFLRYQPSTSWSSYVKGRLAIAKEEYDAAAYYFRKASYGLACGKAVGSLVALSAGLLSSVDTDSFNNGLPLYLYHITTLFDNAKAYNEAAHFGHLALESLPAGQKDPVHDFRTKLLSRLFNAELRLSRFSNAYATLVQLQDPGSQQSCVTALVNKILDPNASMSGPAGRVQTLQSLPWAMYPHLARHMDQLLLSLSKNQSAPATWSSADGQSDYLAIMHAIRISQKDYRGAVSVLYDRLRLIRQSGRARHDPQGTALRHALLSLINLMSCVEPDEAYILVEVDDQNPRHNGVYSEENPHRRDDEDDLKMTKRRRVIVTLDDVRKEYQTLLDKCSRIERGDFDFEVDDDEDDEDEDERTDGATAGESQSRLNFSKVSTRSSAVDGGGAGDGMEF